MPNRSEDRHTDLQPLDYFGWFVAQKLRDRAILHFDGLLKGHWKSPSSQTLQNALGELSDSHKAIFRRAFISSIDNAIHDFLFAVQESADFENRLTITVDGQNVVELTDGIHAEAFGEDGWFARFSGHGEPIP